jgi:hypothetical protein
MMEKFILISIFLWNESMRVKLLPHQLLLGIQEEIVGILLKEVIDKHERLNVNRRT